MGHILVTGGNGFIGTNLVNYLANMEDHQITIVDLYPRIFDPLPAGVQFVQGSLNDSDLIQHILVDRGIDTVYHLAWSSIHETSLNNPAVDIEQNLIPSVHLLESCLMSGVKRFLFMSSGGTVYGIPETTYVSENHPTKPISAYGITKLMVEKYLQMYSYLHGMNYVIFRPSVPYGPYQNPRRRQGAVSVFVYHALRGEEISIWGDGETGRDFFYVDDLTRALVAALKLPPGESPTINLGGNQIFTINQLINIIEQTLNIKIKVSYAPSRKFDVPKINLDIGYAKKLLDWEPNISLQEGILHTAQWLEAHMD